MSLLKKVSLFGKVGLFGKIGLLKSEGFISEYQAVYDSWTTKPNDLIAAAQNTMVKGFVSSGVWAKKDVLYVFAAHTNNNGEALTNWKNPGTHNAVLVNAPAFVPFEGFTGNGTTQYIDSNYNPDSQGVNFIQNSASLFLYTRTFVDASGFDIGAFDGVNFSQIAILNGGGQATGSINGGTIVAANGIGLGLFVTNRSANNAVQLYQNKLLLGVDTDISANPVNINLFMMARNNISAADNFTIRQYAMGGMSSSLNQQNVNDLTDIFEAYMDSNGKGVI